MHPLLDIPSIYPHTISIAADCVLSLFVMLTCRPDAEMENDLDFDIDIDLDGINVDDMGDFDVDELDIGNDTVTITKKTVPAKPVVTPTPAKPAVTPTVTKKPIVAAAVAAAAGKVSGAGVKDNIDDEIEREIEAELKSGSKNK